MFCPEKYSRHKIKIISVQAKRLQDISNVDCLKEGIKNGLNGYYIDYLSEKWSEPSLSPKDSFASLIDKINSKGTWNKNPWVWVYTFEKVEKPINFIE